MAIDAQELIGQIQNRQKWLSDPAENRKAGNLASPKNKQRKRQEVDNTFAEQNFEKAKQRYLELQKRSQLGAGEKVAEAVLDPVFQTIGDPNKQISSFNERLLGGFGRSAFRTAEWLQPGDQTDRMQRNIDTFFPEAGSSSAENTLAERADINSPGAKAGSIAKGASEVTLMAVGGQGLGNVLRAAPLVQRGLQSGNTAVQLGTKVLTNPVVGLPGRVSDAGFIVGEVGRGNKVNYLNEFRNGLAFDVATFGLGRGSKYAKRVLNESLPSLSETKWGKEFAASQTGRKIIDLKDGFVAKVVDDTNKIKKPFKGLVDTKTGMKVTDKIEELVTNVRQFAPKSQARLENNASYQALRQLIAGDGLDKSARAALYDDYSNFIKLRQDAINHNKLVVSGRIKGELKEVPVGTAEQEQAYRLLNEATKNDIQLLYDSGKISEAKYTEWMADPDYTRVQREVLDDSLVKNSMGGLAKASGVADQKLTGSNKEIIDPFTAYEDFSRRVTLEAERQNLVKYIRDQALITGQTKKLRDADQVIKRMQLYGEANQLRPVRNKLAKMITGQKKYVGRIERELDRLNKMGVEEYLANKPAQEIIDLATTTKVIRSTDDLSDALEALRGSDKWKVGSTPNLDLVKSKMLGTGFWSQLEGGKYTQRLTNYAKANNLTEEQALKNLFMKSQGFDEYVDGGRTILLSKRKVEKKAMDLVAGGEMDAKVKGASSTGSKMTNNKFQKSLENLIASDTSKLRLIRKKIAGRDAKLETALDEMIAMKGQYDEVATEVSDLVQQARRLKDLDTDGQTLKVFEKGIKELYEIDPAMAKQLGGVADLELKAIADWVLLPSRLLRGGATSLNPAFAIPNFIKDQVFSGINSKSVASTHNPLVFFQALNETMLKPFGRKTTGLKMFDESEAYKLWRAGNANTNQVDLARNLKSATASARENLGVKNQSLLRDYEDIISATESSTRYQNFLGSYKKALGENRSPEEALSIANQASRENSINFTRRGEIAMFMKIFNPYINAGIQGSARLGRSIKERPVGTGLKIGTALMLPVATSTYYNLNDPERAELYARIPEYERESNIIMVLGGGRGYIKIPLTPGLKEMANPLRNMVESQYLDNRQSFTETAKNLLIDPFNPLGTTTNELMANLIPQGAKPLVELASNRNTFTGNAIVSEKLMFEDPENQVYDSTPQVYRDIGGFFGMSPLRVQHLVRGYTAGGGEGALVMGDLLRGAETGGRSTPEQLAARFAGDAKKLEGEPGMPGGAIANTFYKSYIPTVANRDSRSKEMTQAIQSGDVNKASELAKRQNAKIDYEIYRLKNTYGGTQKDVSGYIQMLEDLKFPVEGGSLSAGSIKYRQELDIK